MRSHTTSTTATTVRRRLRRVDASMLPANSAGASRGVRSGHGCLLYTSTGGRFVFGGRTEVLSSNHTRSDRDVR